MLTPGWKFRADLQNTGVYAAQGPPMPGVKWSFPMKASGSSAAVTNGVVYVGSDDNYVYAIDAVIGRKKWRFPTEFRVVSSPAVVDGVVYVGSDDNHVYAIDAVTGRKKWRFRTGGMASCSPAVVDGVVYVGSGDNLAYVGSGDNYVYAIDAVTGEAKWRKPCSVPYPSSPAVADGVVYVGSGDHNVYAIDADNGKKVSHFTTDDVVSSSPAVADGIVYVASCRSVYAIDFWTGTQPRLAWPTPFQLGGNQNFSSPAVADGFVYIGGENQNVYVIDAQYGTEKWRFATSGAVWSAPAVVDGVVYVGDQGGNVYAINVQQRRLKWKYSTGGPIDSSPAVIDGVVYIGSADDNVYALPPTKRSVLADLSKLVKTINALPAASFSLPALVGSQFFTKALDTVESLIRSNDFGAAANFFIKSILPRIDGCAKPGGRPDSNDFIITCDAQEQLYPRVQTLIADLEWLRQYPP